MGRCAPGAVCARSTPAHAHRRAGNSEVVVAQGRWVPRMRRSEWGCYGDLSHTVAVVTTKPLPFMPTMLDACAVPTDDPV